MQQITPFYSGAIRLLAVTKRPVPPQENAAVIMATLFLCIRAEQKEKKKHEVSSPAPSLTSAPNNSSVMFDVS